MGLAYPKCCSGGEHIALQYEYLYTMSDSYFLDTKPGWYLYFDAGFKEPERKLIWFCPFCGVKLPDVELKLNYPEPIFSTKDGYNCNTCNMKMSDCSCYPPEIMWRLKE